jgi:two-component system sensor histidine kinase CreC
VRLGIGIFLGYLSIAILGAYFVLNVFAEEIKPSARQSMEDSLVDAANLLAELALDDLKSDRLQSGVFSEHVAAYQARRLNASIWGFNRTSPGFRIYITDSRGVVKYDSSHQDEGKDFSQWNDVYLTLRGEYGVRSSPPSGTNESKATSMHVAAPIKEEGQILGVLTIVKSNRAVEPFIERTKGKILRAGYALLAASLIIGLLISYWLSTSVQKLVSYSEAVTRGQRAVLPKVSLTEINRLGEAMELMRERLEGKRYIEEYIATLTHEMKSPITAIQATAELLLETMSESQRQAFTLSISDQTRRLHALIEKMLQQSALENRQILESLEAFDLIETLRQSAQSCQAKLEKKGLSINLSTPLRVAMTGDPFLIQQALTNILENAIDFSPQGSSLELSILQDKEGSVIVLRDHGPGIPAFAESRIFDRYYSLPRPETGAKSTGLGLAFVNQVMVLHNGWARIINHPDGGAEARLFLPNLC